MTPTPTKPTRRIQRAPKPWNEHFCTECVHWTRTSADLGECDDGMGEQPTFMACGSWKARAA